MAITTFNTKGNNVSPTSSTLHVRYEDVDCSSASKFTKTPVPGQFIVAPGKTGLANGANTQFVGTGAEVDAGFLAGTSGVAMCWPSNFRTDADALGNTRIAVVRGAQRFKTKLFNILDTAVALSHANNGYQAGAQVTVALSLTAINGDTIGDRLVINPLLLPLEAGAKSGALAVGYVTRVVTDSTTSGAGEIEIQLYDFPRIVTANAA